MSIPAKHMRVSWKSQMSVIFQRQTARRTRGSLREVGRGRPLPLLLLKLEFAPVMDGRLADPGGSPCGVVDRMARGLSGPVAVWKTPGLRATSRAGAVIQKANAQRLGGSDGKGTVGPACQRAEWARPPDVSARLSMTWQIRILCSEYK